MDIKVAKSIIWCSQFACVSEKYLRPACPDNYASIKNLVIYIGNMNACYEGDCVFARPSQ